jgi:hypothetical protein
VCNRPFSAQHYGTRPDGRRMAAVRRLIWVC